MKKQLQSLLSVASIIMLIVGIAIGAGALRVIAESSSASTGLQLIPDPSGLISAPSVEVRPIEPKRGDFIGSLTIPRLKRTIPIYEGTEPAQLKKGAGHYEKSVLPGVKDNSVIAGHRDSVFTKFGSLKRADLLIVETAYGKFTYKITKFRIVDAKDRSVIVPTDIATLTLSTCYPFYFIGNAPRRFIVTAVLI